MKLTSKKIAEMAGVSRGTVDRIVHGRGHVNIKTAEKVKAIIKKYNYHPNAIGRALVEKKVYTIGTILPETGNPFFNTIKQGINDCVKSYGDYNIKAKFIQLKDLNLKNYLKALSKLNQSCQALALIGYENEKVRLMIERIKEKKPVILFNTDIKTLSAHCFIGIDDYKAGMCVGYLVKNMLGKNANIFLVSGSNQVATQNDRIRGFYNYMQNYPHYHISDIFYSFDHADKIYNLTVKAFVGHHYDCAVNMGSQLESFTLSIESLNLTYKPKIIGFDLIPRNGELLKEGRVNYVLGQSAYEQAYKAFNLLCEHYVHNRSIPKKKMLLRFGIFTPYNVD